MKTAQAQAEQWINLVGEDGKMRARLNVDTGELVIRDRGIHHKWQLCDLLVGARPTSEGACVAGVGRD